MTTPTTPKNFTLVFSLDAVNKIGNALAQRPYIEVAEILVDFQQQVQQQVAAAQMPVQPQSPVTDTPIPGAGIGAPQTP